MLIRPDNWNELTPLEGRKIRLDAWQNIPVEFQNTRKYFDIWDLMMNLLL